MRRLAAFFVTVTVLLIAVPILAWSGDRPLEFNRRDLVVLRAITAQYYRLETAKQDGFIPLYDCIERPADLRSEAMVLHYVQPDRLQDGKLDLTAPEALIYEVQANGKARLAAVKFVMPAALWVSREPPELIGQQLKYKSTMGEYDINPSYELYVWAWRRNSDGLFADWRPEAICGLD